MGDYACDSNVEWSCQRQAFKHVTCSNCHNNTASHTCIMLLRRFREFYVFSITAHLQQYACSITALVSCCSHIFVIDAQFCVPFMDWELPCQLCHFVSQHQAHWLLASNTGKKVTHTPTADSTSLNAVQALVFSEIEFANLVSVSALNRGAHCCSEHSGPDPQPWSPLK